MSNTPKRKYTVKKKKIKDESQEKVIPLSSITVDPIEIPQDQTALPITIDAKTTKNAERVIELSFLDYLKNLNKESAKDTSVNIVQLHNILSEYLGPYILIGYLPDDEPIEMFGAYTPKEKEALLERLRKTFIRHMTMNAP